MINSNYWDVARELEIRRETFITMTLIDVRGSAPQDLGAKAIVCQGQLHWGTIGGGKIEAYAIKVAGEILQQPHTSKVVSHTWNLQRDIGMTCGGEVTVLFERFEQKHWPIAIFGAGHVSQHLCRILAPLDCTVDVFDTRQDWLEKFKDCPSITTHVCQEMAQEISRLSDNTFFICMTQGHQHDVPILYEVFRQKKYSTYVGVIGSQIKGERIKKELTQLGVSQEALAQLRVPIGLPIGSNHLQEIAISIAAELLQVRDLVLPKT